MDNQVEMPRLVISGCDAAGKSTITIDALISSYKNYPECQGIRIADIWKASRLPTSLDIPTDANTHTLGPNIDSNLGGFNVRHIVFPAHSEYALHVTQTIDFAVILSGQIEAVLEAGAVTLTTGDIFIQRATLHGWNNSTDSPCSVLLFIAGAKQR